MNLRMYIIYIILDGFTNREGPGDEDLPGHRGRWKIAYKQWEKYRTIYIYIGKQWNIHCKWMFIYNVFIDVYSYHSWEISIEVNGDFLLPSLSHVFSSFLG